MKEAVVLFDGECNLCDAAVQYIIAHDKQQLFKFAAQQSAYGQQHMALHRLNDDSIAVVVEGKIYTKAKAVAYVVAHLEVSLMVSVLGKAMRVLPAPLGNLAYGLIARNRYRLFGKKTLCLIPTPALKSRFLS